MPTQHIGHLSDSGDLKNFGTSTGFKDFDLYIKNHKQYKRLIYLFIYQK